jgi:hypothetical protein
MRSYPIQKAGSRAIVMPESDNRQCRAEDLNTKVGFHWIRNRYGPPPGIPETTLAKIETQSDEEFFIFFLRWSPEEQLSLMIGERYRRRTFKAPGWPSLCPADANLLAAEGFFWTGKSDRTRCAFCDGFLGNWENGDPPINHQHRRFFPHCKRAQRKPCPNIPIPPPELATNNQSPLDIHAPIGGARDNGGVIKANDVISASDRGTALALTNQARHKRYQLESDRLNSFKYWKPPPTFADAANITITPHNLCEAGFFHEGPGDLVRCFWCDGGLENWLPHDDPWAEHASWYPGCRHVYHVKGPEFIADIQLKMTPEQRQEAAKLEYNNAGLDFLHNAKPIEPIHRIRQQDWYLILNGLGFEHLELDELARSHNFHLDLFDIASIVDTLLDRRANDYSDIKLITSSSNNTELPIFNNLLNAIQELNVSTHKPKDKSTLLLQQLDNAKATITHHLPASLDLTKYVNDHNQPDDNLTEHQRNLLIIAANTCIQCNAHPKNTVTLPCGHLIYCNQCVAHNTPNNCHACHRPLTGTCQVFFA